MRTSKAMLLLAAASATVAPALVQAAPVQQSGSQTTPPPAQQTAPASTRPAETPPVQDSAPADDTAATTDEDIVVTGFRASLDQAIDLKRDAITFRDSIVAEDIGRFPEANVAESLQRIPGVELVRDGNSNEGQTIRLRGLPSTFTVTTFNGSPVYTTSTGGVGNASRTFNYDVFPSELFGRADVYKSPLAELADGGIAGVVDLQTARPFDGKGGRKIRYSVSGNYNSQSGDYNPRGNFLISQTVGNFGALISIAGAKVTNGRAQYTSTGAYNTSSPNATDLVTGGAQRTPAAGNLGSGNNFNYNFAAPGINLNGFTQQEIRNAFLPRFFAIQAGKNERDRFGASAALQYKDDSWNISLEGLYSIVKDDNQVADIRFPIRDSVNALALVPLDVRVDENQNLQGKLGNVQFNYTSFFDQSQTKYKYLALNTAYKVTPTLEISTQLSISDSRAFRNNITLGGDARQNRHELTFNTEDDPLFPTLRTNKDLLDRLTYYTNTGPTYSGGYREEDDKLRAGRIIANWNYGLGEVDGRLRAGFTYNRNEKSLLTLSTGNLYNSLNIPGVGLFGAATTTVDQKNAFITSFLQPFDTRDFVPGAPSSLPQQFLAFTPGFAYETLNAVEANRAAAVNFGSTYTAIETIKAYFVQSDFTGDLFGRRMRVNIGGRYVETITDINNYKIAAGNSFVPDQRKDVYRRFLPSVTLAYDLLPDLILRASAGKTFTRAPIQSLAASISLPAGGAGNLFLNVGNPELKPESSTSLDGAIEWYFAKGGVLSLAGYRKTISGRAIPLTTTAPFSSLGIPAGIFTINIQNTLALNPDADVELRQPINAETYSLSGIEIAYQQQLTFLPEPFDGLGVLASFTRVNSEGLIREYITPAIARVSTPAPGTTAVPAVNLGSFDLNEVPDITYQLSAFYEKGPFAIRASYNWRGESATVNAATTQSVGLQRYNVPVGFLDANMSYKFSPWLEVRLDAVNILESVRYEFYRDVQGRFGDERSRADSVTLSGRTITLGIRGSF